MKKALDPALKLKKTTADYAKEAELIAQVLLAEKTKEELAGMLALEIMEKQIEADLREIYEPQITALKNEAKQHQEKHLALAEKKSHQYLDQLIVAHSSLRGISSKNQEKAKKAARTAATKRAEEAGKDEVFVEYFTRSDNGYFNKRGAKTQFDIEMANRHGIDTKTVERWRLQIQRFVKNLPNE